MKNFLKLLLIIDLVVVNILVGFLIYNQIRNPNNSIVQTSEINTSEVRMKDVEELRGQVGTLINRMGNLELTPYPSPAGTSGQIKTVTVVAPTKTPTKNISYVNIPGTGETISIDWVDIAGTDFYFDKAEYPGLFNIIWEGNIRLFNGSGMGYIRLFDVTHGIAVVGSEVNTISQSDTLVSSGLLNVWSGKNLYRIQGKSNSSDRLIYNWGKLKITTQD